MENQPSTVNFCGPCQMPTHARCLIPRHVGCICVEIHFPIVDDPSSAYKEMSEEEVAKVLQGPEAMQRALSIDFDGVLHWYRQGWKGHYDIYDKPVPGAVENVNALFDAGFKLYVLTSRQHLEPVAVWLHQNHFPPMTLTRQKPIAYAYIDDRGIRFEDNWPSIRKFFC